MALHEFLGHFVSAAVAADERYVRCRDASEIGDGIEVWERLADSGALAGEPPEGLVDAAARGRGALRAPQRPR